jgi:hypothetical protein
MVVAHFRAPTSPDTTAGESVFGGWDMRYWSICDYDSTGTEVYGCVPDDAVPRDADGWVTVVVSEAGQRPANATSADGVAWVPWSPQNEIQLVQRNLLPSPAFPHASEDIATPAENPDAARIMGSYYPTAAYCSETTFEQGGWQACLPGLARSLAGAGEDTVAVGCTHRLLTFVQHPAAPFRVVQAVVYVDGRRVRTLRAHAIRAVRVDPPAASVRFSVRIVATLSDGEVVARRVTYDGCTAARPAVTVLAPAR